MKESRKLLVTAGAGLLLCGLCYAPHAIKKHRLEAYERQLRAQGEKLDLAELAPPAPTVGNGAFALLAAAYRFAYLSDYHPSPRRMVSSNHAMVAWSRTVLRTERLTNLWPALAEQLALNDGTLAEVCDALTNPVVQVDLDYRQGASLLLPHLGKFKGTAMGLSAATIFFLHNHQPDQAWETLLAVSRLPKVWHNEPILISQLVRAATTAVGVETVWEALQYPGWSDDQLAQLQETWRTFTLTSELESATTSQRATARQALIDMRESQAQFSQLLNSFGRGSGAPSFGEWLEGFLKDPAHPFQNLGAAGRFFSLWRWYGSYDEQLGWDRYCQLDLENLRRLTSDFSVNRLRTLTSTQRAKPDRRYSRPSYVLMPDDGVSRFWEKILGVDTQREMVVAAIALERYHLRHARWPASLNDLVPEFLSTLPRDFMDGQALRYRPNPDGTFRLYSVGDDCRDDGGDPTPPKSIKTPRWTNGRDWVWPQPATAAEVDAYDAALEAARQHRQANSMVTGTATGREAALLFERYFGRTNQPNHSKAPKAR